MVFLSLQVSLNLWNETKWEKYYWWPITSSLNYINSKYFWDNGELRLYQQFLINVPKKSWMISYTVCHLLLTGFLKWSNFPHQSNKENNWNCFSLFFKNLVEWFIFWLENQLFLSGNSFFFFFSTKIVSNNCSIEISQRAVLCKVEKVRLASCWFWDFLFFIFTWKFQKY